MEENSQLSHSGKNGLLKPQNCGPFLPIHPSNTQNAFWVWKREGNDNQIVEERAQSLPVAWGSQNSMRMGEKWKSWVHNGLGMPSQDFTCPTSQKHTFQKWVISQIRIWPPCLSHPKEITSSTTFRWLGTKRQKVSWQLYGFYLRHLDLPHRLKVWIIPPPYSLWNHAPIFLTLRRIASCGIFINLHFTWCLKHIVPR